jgi:hypothetical protein
VSGVSDMMVNQGLRGLILLGRTSR